VGEFRNEDDRLGEIIDEIVLGMREMNEHVINPDSDPLTDPRHPEYNDVSVVITRGIYGKEKLHK
jgi:hypothetical protein